MTQAQRPIGDQGTAWSYLRFSTPKQQWGDSLRRQTDAARAYAARHGLKLEDRTYQDLGVSGYTGRNIREGALGAFVKAVEEGKVKRGSYLLVESLDRLSREKVLAAFESFRRLLELGVVVVTLQDERQYTKESLSESFTDLMMSLLTMQRAHEESLTKSRRLSAVWQNKRKTAATAGVPLTKMCPSWLTLSDDRKIYVEIPDKVKTVRHIFDLAASGRGHESIARTLNREGVKPIGRATHWHASFVLKILENQAVIGTFQPGRRASDPEGRRRYIRVFDEPIPGYFPAIIPTALYLKVRQARKERRVPAGPRTMTNLFQGLLSCGHCGGPMHLRNHGKRHQKWSAAYLVCSKTRAGASTCPRGDTPWDYPAFERNVVAALHGQIDWHSMEPRVKETAQTAIEELGERAAVIEVDQKRTSERIANLVKILEDGGGESAALSARLRELEAHMAEIAREGERIAGQLEVEASRLASAKETVKEATAAFVKYMTEPPTKETRERLAVALRSTVSAMRLSVDRKHGRIVEVELREPSSPNLQGVLRLPFDLLLKLEATIQKKAREKLKLPIARLQSLS